MKLPETNEACAANPPSSHRNVRNRRGIEILVATIGLMLSVLTASGFTPTYDEDGNQTRIQTDTGIWNVEYDAENRPVLWTNGGTNLVMRYDRLGRKVSSYSIIGGVTNQTKFVFNGQAIVRRNRAEEVDDYIHDASTTHGHNPLYTQTSIANATGLSKGDDHYFFYDGCKNVSELIDQQAKITNAHYDYSPFGMTARAIGQYATHNPFQFSGEYHDMNLALNCYSQRDMDPYAGRWTTRDPLDSDPNDYSFCRNMFGEIDLYGLRRMVSGGALPDFLYPKQTRDILSRIEALRSIVDSQGRHCYEIQIKDLEYANAAQINADVDNGWQVFIIGHGRYNEPGVPMQDGYIWTGDGEPNIGYQKNSGEFLPVSSLKVPAENLFGCFISPRIRREPLGGWGFWKKYYYRKDTFEKMYPALLDRLPCPQSADRKPDICCTPVKICIYEGEITSPRLSSKVLKHESTDAVLSRAARRAAKRSKQRKCAK